MELLIIIGLIWLFYYLNKKARQQQCYNLGTPDHNLPIQYAYTVDEWYSLRTRFDELIEADWQAYRAGSMDRATYKARCDQAVRQIIPAEYIDKFRTLYQWGARAAAIRVAKEGYEPGMIDYANYSRIDLRNWKPVDYHPCTMGSTAARNGWPKCIPGRNSFLDLYPDGNILEIMGCGMMENGSWTPEKEKEAWCRTYYAHIGNGENERDKAIAYFKSRGYDGHSYAGDQRGFGDLTQTEIAKKYEFVILDPETGEVENSARCKVTINPSIKHKKEQRQRNEAMSEQERLAKIQRAINI